jgi:serine/threonine-protein kinase RsbW
VNHLPVETVRLDLPATYTSLTLLRACVTELIMQCDVGEHDPAIYSVQLAVHETGANIIDHAYCGDFNQRFAATLSLYRELRQIVVELYDSGRAFRFEDAPLPDLDAPQEHGYGLFLIRNTMDDVIYEPRETGNYWRLMKQL